MQRFFAFTLYVCLFAGPAFGAEEEIPLQSVTKLRDILPKGDTQVNPLDDLRLRIGFQYRVMWNGSNLPLAGVTTATDPKSNDFFRQRMRLNIDVAPNDKVGGFMQLEYRGGFGGTSPEFSDPRGNGLSLNAFNRLEARGVRYGYVYYRPITDTYLAAGIIPLSDRLGDTLFSADWDFNVGGIVADGKLGTLGYRAAYVRLVDGVATADDREVVGENSDLITLDFAVEPAESIELGSHFYYLYAGEDIALEAGLPGEVQQAWIGLSAQGEFDGGEINGFAVVNTGEFGDVDNTGYSAKVEAKWDAHQSVNIAAQVLYSSGDLDGENSYRTVQGIFGVEGYWAYTHLFTANGPSDVNDLGIDLDQGGLGLLTGQARVRSALLPWLDNDVFVGVFQSGDQNELGNDFLGTEVGTMFVLKPEEYLALDVGFAGAFLGDFFDSENDSASNLYEVFARFQLHI